MYSTEINIIKKTKQNEPIENKINLRQRSRAESWLAEQGGWEGAKTREKGEGQKSWTEKGEPRGQSDLAKDVSEAVLSSASLSLRWHHPFLPSPTLTLLISLTHTPTHTTLVTIIDRSGAAGLI